MFPLLSYSKSLDRRLAAKIKRNYADAEGTDMDRLPKNGSGVKELIVKVEIELTGLDRTV